MRRCQRSSAAKICKSFELTVEGESKIAVEMEQDDNLLSSVKFSSWNSLLDSVFPLVSRWNASVTFTSFRDIFTHDPDDNFHILIFVHLLDVHQKSPNWLI